MIIDNEKTTMVGRLRETMPHATEIDIAVGYFFISGFAEIMDSLKWIESDSQDHVMKILTSPVTDRTTAEALHAAHETLTDIGRNMSQRESPEDALATVGKNIRGELEHMQQTGPQRNAVIRIIDLIRREKIQIKVYTKEQLHAKLYLAKLDGYTRQESIIGSSNFSISGLRTHAELNFATNDDSHYGAFLEWFNEHWNDPSCRPFTKEVAQILENSWAGNEYSPKTVAGKAVLGENPEIPIKPSTAVKLYDFQQDAANRAIKKLEDYGGVMIADVVGTGKSYIGTAVLKHLVDAEILEPLVICPARLMSMWRDLLSKHGLAPNVLSNGNLDDLDRYNYCNAILIDESHAFKDDSRVRYNKLAEYMDNKMRDARIIMLTATPISNTVYDLRNQLGLFQPDMLEKIPVLEETEAKEGRSKLEVYFGDVMADREAKDADGNIMMTKPKNGMEKPKTEKFLTVEGREKIRDLLKYVLIRRTRSVILDRLKKEGRTDSRGPYLKMNGEKHYFPKCKLYNLEYDAVKTYEDKFSKIESIISSMTFARYVPGNYIREGYEQKKPYDDLANLVSLGGIVLTSLLKLMESSIMAFDSSVWRYGEGHKWFLRQLEEGKIAVGKDFREIIHKLIDSDDIKIEVDLMKEMETITSSYEPEAFEMDKWMRDVEDDMKKFGEITEILRGKNKKIEVRDLDRLFVPRDDKLVKLLDLVNEKQEKILIFTESAVTARYIFRFLKGNNKNGREIVQVDSKKDKNEIKIAVERFAPKFNNKNIPPEEEIDILISTDMLSEGLNLQSGRIIINYDFHWNPVRLIQRLGRIDRLGSDHDIIEAHNFLTTPEVDSTLGLLVRVRKRLEVMRGIMGTGGSSGILEITEPLDPDGVCDIYNKKESILEPGIGGGILDPTDTESEELAEVIRKNKQERKRYEDLPYGIRSSVGSDKLLVACAAEDILAIPGEHIVSTEFKRYYEVTDYGVRGIRQSSFLSQMIDAGKRPPIKEPAKYDGFIAEAWRQFRRDGRDTMRSIPIHKYQKYFDKLLKRIEFAADLSLKHRILETRKFVRSRMLQTKHPYRDLTKLHREVKKDGLNGEQVLEKLEEIRGKYGNITYKKTIRRPRILYSMMVGK